MVSWNQPVPSAHPPATLPPLGRCRRYRIAALCPRGVVPVSIVNYPLLGAPGAFTDPPLPPGGPFSRSAYVPDACISPHPRFG
jgi:hypothetical protein